MVEPLILLRRWPFKVLVVLACAAGQAFALTYEEILDDNATLPMDQRLDLLDRRATRLSDLEREIRTAYAAIESAIASGKAMAIDVKEKQRLLQAATGSSTVRAALGEGAPRGLAWHCSRAREIVPQMSRLATAAKPALQDHSAQLRAIPVGSDNAASALQAQYSRLQAAVTGLLDPEEREQLRADLKEIDLGLQHAWGSYTTLRLMADETTKVSSTLVQSSTTLAGLADGIEKQIARYLDEQRIVDETLGRINPEYVAEVAVRDEIRTKWARSRLPGLKNRPYDIVSGARFFLEPWTTAAQEAQTAAKDGMRPFPDAVSACRDWEQPVRDFDTARTAAQRDVNEQFIRIDEAYALRAAQIRQDRSTAEEVSRIAQETVSELDRQIAEFAAGPQLETARRLRREGSEQIDLMKQFLLMLRDEERIVEEQRAAIPAMKAALLLPQGE